MNLKNLLLLPLLFFGNLIHGQLVETCDPDRVYNELQAKYAECMLLEEGSPRNSCIQNPRGNSVRKIYNDYFTAEGCKDHWTTKNAPHLLSWSYLHGKLDGDFTLSVASEIQKSDMRIFPSPVINTLNISNSRGVEDVLIYNPYGQLIKQKSFHSLPKNVEIPVSMLTNGIYFVMATSQTETYVQKLLKK